MNIYKKIKCMHKILLKWIKLKIITREQLGAPLIDDKR